MAKSNIIKTRLLGKTDFDRVIVVPEGVKPVPDEDLLNGNYQSGVHEAVAQVVDSSDPVYADVVAEQQPPQVITGWGEVSGATNISTAPTPKSTHKLYTTPDSLDFLRNLPNTYPYNKLKEFAARKNNPIGLAFSYLVNGVVSDGVKAINNLWDDFPTGTISGIHRGGGTGGGEAAMVYSWCYDLFSRGDVKVSRSQYEQKMVDLLGRSSNDPGDNPFQENGNTNNPPWLITNDKLESTVTGHNGSHSNTAALIAIAIYRDRPQMYNDHVNWMIQNFWPDQDLLVNGLHHQGNQYSYYRAAAMCRAASAVRAIAMENGQSDPLALSRRYAFSALMNRVMTETPDGYQFPWGDLYHKYSIYALSFEHASNLISLATYARHAELQKWAFDKLMSTSSDVTEGHAVASLLMLGLHGGYKPADFTKLPKTYISKPPFVGAMIKETMERGSRYDTFQVMHLAANFQSNNHNHLQDLSWSGYCGARLTAEVGWYKGGADFRSEKRWGYATNAISKNCIMLYDANQTKEGFSGDGNRIMPRTGQMGMDNEKTLNNLPKKRAQDFLNSEFNYGKLRSSSRGERFVQVKSDAKDGYHAYKANKVERHFVSILTGNSKARGIVVTKDIIEVKDQDVKPIWLQHCLSNPTRSGNSFTTTRTDGQNNGRMKSWVFGESARLDIVNNSINDDGPDTPIHYRERDGNLRRNRDPIVLTPLNRGPESFANFCVETILNSYNKSKYIVTHVHLLGSPSQTFTTPEYNDSGAIVIRAADHTIVMNKNGNLTNGYSFAHKGGAVLLLDLSPGARTIGNVTHQVVSGENSIWLDNLAPGTYNVE